MDIMERCIPKAEIPDRKNLPWLTTEIVKVMRKRSYYYRRYRCLNRPNDLVKYKSLRNQVVALLQDSKVKFFTNLNPKSAKSFWSAVKYLNKQQSSIPTLVTDKCSVSTDTEKADLMKCYFSECFNCSQPPLNSDCYQVLVPESCPHDLLCTEDDVYELLSCIDNTKFNRPGTSARMLNSQPVVLCLPLPSSSILNWVVGLIQQTIVQYLCSLFSANC